MPRYLLLLTLTACGASQTPTTDAGSAPTDASAAPADANTPAADAPPPRPMPNSRSPTPARPQRTLRESRRCG